MSILFIIIAGASASGKTTFAKNLKQNLIEYSPGEAAVALIAMDDFYCIPSEKEHLPIVLQEDFDAIEAYNLFKLREFVQDLKEGKTVIRPSYNFAKKERINSDESLALPKIVIIEGILAAHPEVLKIFPGAYTISIYRNPVQTLNLRMQRDKRERNTLPAETKAREYKGQVGMHFWQTIAPSLKEAIFSIDFHQEEPNRMAAETQEALANLFEDEVFKEKLSITFPSQHDSNGVSCK